MAKQTLLIAIEGRKLGGRGERQKQETAKSSTKEDHETKQTNNNNKTKTEE